MYYFFLQILTIKNQRKIRRNYPKHEYRILLVLLYSLKQAESHFNLPSNQFLN